MKMIVFLIIGYMFLFIHRPFEVWPWLGDFHVERVYMFVTLIFWAFFVQKTWVTNHVNLGIGFLATSIVLSTFFSDSTSFDSPVVLDWFKIAVFYVLVVTTVREEKDLHIIVGAFVVIMGMYELHSLYEYLCGRGVWRMGIWRMVGIDTTRGSPNGFAASVNYGIPMLLPAVTLARKRWHYIFLAALFVLAVACIILTGSRTGLAGLALLLMGCCLVSKHRWKFLPVLWVVAYFVWGNIDAELQNRYLSLFDSSRGPVNAEQSADSRVEFFLMALELWKDNFMLGVGPGGFSSASGTGMQSHSLYAQTISNLGMVGVLAMLILITGFFRNFFEGKMNYRSVMSPSNNMKFCYFVLMATTVGVLQLLFLGLGGHNLFRYNWLWYGAFSALALKFMLMDIERQAQGEARL